MEITEGFHPDRGWLCLRSSLPRKSEKGKSDFAKWRCAVWVCWGLRLLGPRPRLKTTTNAGRCQKDAFHSNQRLFARRATPTPVTREVLAGPQCKLCMVHPNDTCCICVACPQEHQIYRLAARAHTEEQRRCWSYGRSLRGWLRGPGRSGDVTDSSFSAGDGTSKSHA